MQEIDKKLSDENVKSKSQYKGILFLLELVAIGVLIGLLFTSFIIFETKWGYAELRAIDFIFNNFFYMSLIFGIEETAIVLLVCIAISCIVVLILFIKSIVSLAKRQHSYVNYVEDIVYGVFVLSVFFLISSISYAGIFMAYYGLGVSSTYPYVPSLITLPLFCVFSIIKSYARKKENNKYLFFKSRNYSLRIWFSVMLMLVFSIFIITISVYAKFNYELLGAVLLIVALSVLFIVRNKKGKKMQDYLKSVALKRGEKTAPTNNDSVILISDQIEKGSVEEKLIKIAREKAIESEQYGDYTSIKDVCDEFIKFARSRGVDVDIQSAMDIFSAMASTRSICIKGDAIDYLKSVVRVLKEFFGGEKYIFDISQTHSEENIIKLCVEENDERHYFIEDLYNAKLSPKNICVSAFVCEEGLEIDGVIGSLEKYFRAPQFGDLINLGCAHGIAGLSSGSIDAPANLWVFFISESKNGAIGMTAEEYSWTITLKSKPDIAPVDDESINNVISFHDFINLSNKALDNNFIPLDTWKKIDKIEEYLESVSSFKILNPVWRQIERYTSVLVSCGEETIKAMDCIMSYKILPYFIKFSVNRKSGITLSECIDNIFGLENVPLTHKTLTELGLDR